MVFTQLQQNRGHSKLLVATSKNKWRPPRNAQLSQLDLVFITPSNFTSVEAKLARVMKKLLESSMTRFYSSPQGGFRAKSFRISQPLCRPLGTSDICFTFILNKNYKLFKMNPETTNSEYCKLTRNGEISTYAHLSHFPFYSPAQYQGFDKEKA